MRKKIFLTFDIDNDFIENPRETTNGLNWSGISNGLPQVLQVFEELGNQFNKKYRISIFCRGDDQITKIMGNTDWVFKKTQETIDQLNLKNVEISLEWHPHLYAIKNGKWQQTTDDSLIEKQLIETFESLKLKNVKFSSSRIGECFYTSKITNILTGLDIKIDCTPLPGRKLEHTDWTNAPTDPYKPDPNDFSKEGNSNLVFLPFTMINVLAPYENQPKPRYLNLLYKNEIINDELININSNIIVTILHPYEIFNFKHQLLGGLKALRKNLEVIEKCYNPNSYFTRSIIP